MSRRRQSLSGFRLSKKPNANVRWPKPLGAAIGVSELDVEDAIVQKPVDNVTLRAEEGEALIARVHLSNLAQADARVVEQIIRLYCWVAFALQEATRRVKRLRNVFFGSGRKPKTPPESAASVPSSNGLGEDATGGDGVSVAEASPGFEAAGGAADPTASESEALPPPRGGHRLGTGRLGADAYAGAERVECHHEALAVGQRCPVCGQGTLYELPPGSAMRIDGHALLSAIRYALQKLRCSACGQIFTASLPTEAGEDKYSPRARAVLAIGRYYLGLPFYRLQSYQAMLGVPVADATQWDQIEKVGDWSYVVFASLETLAAQGELISQDDTSVRILTLLKENQERQVRAEAMGFSRSQERTGMCTTALVVKVGERILCLYYSGRSHAGENLAALLEQRKADHGTPLVMSDALSRNAVDETTVIRCHCLAHGRRQFSDLEDVFPVECRVVLDVLKHVFDHDEQAREERMSSQARLAYHRQ